MLVTIFAQILLGLIHVAVILATDLPLMDSPAMV